VRGPLPDLGLDGVQPASLGGRNTMVAVGQEQSLVGAEGNHRRQLT